jgi:[NiFe] hydrogenase diaphorase moiety small subunit
MPDSHTLHIDDQEIPFVPGQTVLQAALAAGFDIPHLCYHPSLAPIGSCRLCLVEVGGRKLSSCTLAAENGQTIASAALQSLRASLVKMLLGQGRHSCLRCEKTGDCRLQETATALQAPAAAPSEQAFPARDDSHPEVMLEYSRCILCGICVQASHELDGKSLFGFGGGSGGEARLVINSPSGLLQDSGISAEDHAVRFCPVGALMTKQKPAEFAGLEFDMGGWGL